MHLVYSIFVSCLLTNDQNQTRVEVNQELLATANDNKNGLKNMLTNDEFMATALK